jgi:hypothetical protein
VIKVVDRCNSINDAMGPVKSNQHIEKRGEGQDSKKRGDKSAIANPVSEDELKPFAEWNTWHRIVPR